MYMRENARYELQSNYGYHIADITLPAWATPEDVWDAVRDYVNGAVLSVKRVGEISKWGSWSLASDKGTIYYQVVKSN